MRTLDLLDRSATEALAALCRRSMADPPTADELRGALFAPDQPAVVRGDPECGVVASVREAERGFVRLLVVAPEARRKGLGTKLLAAAEADLEGCRSVTVGADPPYWLFPGVETSETGMLCLLESRRYRRVDANFHMAVDLDAIPTGPRDGELAAASHRPEVARFCEAHWPGWRAEALRALDNGTLVVGHDDRGLAGFCAWDVNRRGLVGPVAVRPDLVGQGRGLPLLLAALHRQREAGRRRIEIAWVGPVRPYARVGAQVSRVFLVYEKRLP
jgi:GNAT superfamily N-acetyltransferase